MRKLSARAGPELVAATVPVRTKMPAPMITPTPNTTRSRGPSSLRSLWSGSSVSAIDCSIDFVRKRLMAGGFRSSPRRNSALDRVLRVDGRTAVGEAGHLLHDPERDRLRGEADPLEDRAPLGVAEELLRDAVQAE